MVNSGRHSAGRPRKVSRRSAEETSRQTVERPRKVSQGTTAAKKVPAKHEATWGSARKAEKKTKPTVIKVDGEGRERTWGQLSRATALKVGRLWEDTGRKIKVFLEKDRQRKEVFVEIRIQGGREKVWFVENPQPLHQREGGDDQAITEDDVVETVTEEDPVTGVPTPR